MRLARRPFLVFAALCSAAPITLAQTSTPAGPRLHHVGLNSVDPEKAIAWYLKVWPTATRTTVAGYPAVQSDMLVLFNKVDRPPAGAWRHDLHRAEAQSAFWHIGANINTTDIKERLNSVGVFHLPLFIAPNDTARPCGAPDWHHTLELRVRRNSRMPPPRRRATVVSATSSRPTACYSSSPAAPERATLSPHSLLPRTAALRRQLVRRAPRHGASADARLER
jgi:hypothetical protein